MPFETMPEALNRDIEIERLIAETRAAIVNTSDFLDHLAKSEENTRQVIQRFVEDLELKLKLLQAE